MQEVDQEQVLQGPLAKNIKTASMMISTIVENKHIQVAETKNRSGGLSYHSGLRLCRVEGSSFQFR